MNFEKRYLFQGHAVAAALSLHADDGRKINTCLTDVSAALPVTGGCLMAASGPQSIIFDDRTLLSFQRATAQVVGDDRPSVQVTSDCSVEGLNVLDRISAVKIATQHSSEDSGNGESARFASEGPHIFEGVAVDGRMLLVQLFEDDTFLKTPTKGELAERFEKDDAFRDECGQRLFTAEEAGLLGRLLHKIPLVNGYIVTTIVKRLTFPDGPPPGVTIEEPNVLVIRGFGKVFFGELFIGDTTRRLTLLRFKFDSAELGPPKPSALAFAPAPPPPPPPPPPTVSGTGVICESKPNGETT